MKYKILLLSIASACVLSCKNDTKPTSLLHQAIQQDSVKVSGTGGLNSKIQQDTLQNAGPIEIFPNDSLLYGKMIAPGTYHDGEAVIKTAGKWQGLFKGRTGFYIADTDLQIKRVKDIVLDEGNEKTGWEVKPINKDSCIVLLSDLSLSNKAVANIKLSKYEITPGESVSFIFNNQNYKLTAEGRRCDKGNDIIIENYKLYLEGMKNGKPIKQLLAGANGFTYYPAYILFAADIDNDGFPDFIIDTSFQENVETPTLYLSGKAPQNELVKAIAQHSSTGC